MDCKSMDTNGDGYTDMVDMTLVYNYILPYVKAEGQKHQLRAYARWNIFWKEDKNEKNVYGVWNDGNYYDDWR